MEINSIEKKRKRKENKSKLISFFSSNLEKKGEGKQQSFLDGGLRHCCTVGPRRKG